ncbi:germination protein, Ger(x)C family [Paenibacillus sp. UNC496MF]|uniref:Ger(x)C family spore germination protein n=1 Tax=Paenibacillus sp. UNC496MF TaxID=1502753 RepID=UPI0008E0654B|nr:Ger(x)C family spore germination C-terminal domain-containing protein [Paenibacillus sp. UNC496MF]SFI86653.1 germination protein, Ger(x)C family [Paenibacillus sp. UNC496MF]
MKPITVLLCLLLCLPLCAGCWDMKEINELAIVNLGAADKDPETGKITAYYQVINPSSLSNRPGADKAAVYTFKFEDYSLGRFTKQTTTLMPRRLFMPHMQVLILSERYAKQGIEDMINFVEMSPDRRTNILFLVAESPVETILNSFSPLERMPGRYIRSLLDLSNNGYGFGTPEPIRVKNLVIGLYRKQAMVVPLIRYTSPRPAEVTDRLEDVNIRKQSFLFAGGAVLLQGRMVGKIDFDEKEFYFILNKDVTSTLVTLRVGGGNVDVEADGIRVKRRFRAGGAEYRLRADLRIVNNEQSAAVTIRNMREVEQAFDRYFERKADALFRLSADKGWDLLGLQDHGVKDWRSAKVTFDMRSETSSVGNTNGPLRSEGRN